MIPRKSVKKPRFRASSLDLPKPQSIVGVIASLADFDRAQRLQKPPDLFELRLDLLAGSIYQIEEKLSRLFARRPTCRGAGVPIIITARDPHEGGASNLSFGERRALLMRFLPWASYLDVELRSARRLQTVLTTAGKRNVRLILSFHDLNSTPDPRSLCTKARRAKSLGANIVKIATRTDSPEQVKRLLDFMKKNPADLPVSAQGIGKLGRVARRQLMREGSVLNYAGINRITIRGQPTLSEIRRWTLALQC